MAGPYLWLREEFGPAVKGACGATDGWPWSLLVPRNSPVAGRDTPPIGRVSGSGLSRAWVEKDVLELGPRYFDVFLQVL